MNRSVRKILLLRTINDIRTSWPMNHNNYIFILGVLFVQRHTVSLNHLIINDHTRFFLTMSTIIQNTVWFDDTTDFNLIHVHVGE